MKQMCHSQILATQFYHPMTHSVKFEPYSYRNFCHRPIQRCSHLHSWPLPACRHAYRIAVIFRITLCACVQTPHPTNKPPCGRSTSIPIGQLSASPLILTKGQYRNLNFLKENSNSLQVDTRVFLIDLGPPCPPWPSHSISTCRQVFSVVDFRALVYS